MRRLLVSLVFCVVVSSTAAAQSIQQATVTLTDTQTRAMVNQPATLVAGEANKAHIPILVVVRTNLTTAYTANNTNPISVGLLDTFGGQVFNVPADVLTTTGRSLSYTPAAFDVWTPSAFWDVESHFENQAITIAGGPIISGGDSANTVTVIVFYLTVDL